MLAAFAPLAAQSQTATGWDKTAQPLRGHNRIYQFRCPAKGTAGTIWGTGIYTDNSSVCTAAVHAGKITLAGGGLVTIGVIAGNPAYSGSRRHGITSLSYGHWGGSFAVLTAHPLPAIPAPLAANGGSTWSADATAFRGNNGRRYTYNCPANGDFGSAYGTDTYTDDSSICTAAVHAGLITQAGGGAVAIEIRGSRNSYAASSRNGVDTQAYGAWAGSFVFVRGGRVSIEGGGGGWNATAVFQRGRNSAHYTFVCPANGDLGSVWGTDTYTDDSSVCTAAVHAGLITQAGGGIVVIEIRPGESSYAASSRNGVDSQSYGPWAHSFVFVRP